ncbi:hypothetical protein FGADI_9356 [Fusarium gaditjirri]|uniref:Protein kinase domain-containing protein n=1 Tax=Fusarium gaditjirri TaxID=282569 RepID=A0A8H4T008_9HYPO|nr:hypothetical protein FGADI_9356 [Fusarium gaditjirri]
MDLCPKVKIHKDHHSFAGYKEFALKTILPAKERTRDVFKQELIAFRKVRPGPNLVELVSAFEISGKDQFMLLFPWADGETLFDGSHPKAVAWWKLLGQFIKSTSFLYLTREPPMAKLETLEYILMSNRPTFYTFAKKQPAIHLEFSKLQTLVSPSFTVYHLGQERADVLPIDAEYRSPEHDIGYIISVDIWALGCIFSEVFTWMLLEHEARQEFRRARMQDALFSGDWNYIENGFENDIEDNFFQRHVDIKTSTIITQQIIRDPPKAGCDSEREIARKAEARLEELSPSKDCNKINQTQTSRLKPSVSQWIARLKHDIHHKNGPAFLGG